MVKYSRAAKVPEKSAKAMGVDLRCSYKNTYNTAEAIRGMKLEEAKEYLQAVIDKKRCIPYRRYKSGVGRCAQIKAFKETTQGRWPVKSCQILLGLLKNAESNAEFIGHQGNSSGLDLENLTISHIQVQRAAPGRRRTYRAHGRINPYMSMPCHVEMIISEDADVVEKPEGDKPKKFTKKQLAKRRLVAAN